jgi:DNA polymerase-3 subunit gamma/tau
MDQAISCCTDTLTAEVVRSLVGSVSTEVLERVMNAVHENSSDEVLRIVDKLMVEGQSATHFAKQTVRFLRNALVAKVAGIESPILQISTDEKKRVSNVAAQFGEEELTRFLQIMLRTHGDVSYKQEQRFHLELGLLKMVHAQRLLPLEQLLSSVRLTDAAPAASPAARPSAPAARPAAPASRPAPPPAFTQRPPGVPPIGGGASPFGQPVSKPSPFEADKARKDREKMSAAPDSATLGVAPSSGPMGISGQPMPGTFGPGIRAMGPQAIPAPGVMAFDNGSALAVAPRVESSNSALDLDAIREAVLQAMETGGSQMLVHALDEGQWAAEGSQVSIQVGMSDAMIELSYTREQEKLSAKAATQVAGRAVKVRLVSGAASETAGKARPARIASTGGAESIKTKAADEPVVKRMMEKFGAEIRIVMDRTER